MGENKEHLLWVPQIYRRDKLSWLPHHLRVLGGSELRIGWEDAYDGEDWTKIYIGDHKQKEDSLEI